MIIYEVANKVCRMYFLYKKNAEANLGQTATSGLTLREIQLLDCPDALAAAEAENKRLREALESIETGCSFPENDVMKAIRDRARQALAEKP